MDNIFYCVTHEEWFRSSTSESSNECFVTTSAPPELPENWMLTTFPPTDEELAQMDASAEELRLQFEG